MWPCLLPQPTEGQRETIKMWKFHLYYPVDAKILYNLGFWIMLLKHILVYANLNFKDLYISENSFSDIYKNLKWSFSLRKILNLLLYVRKIIKDNVCINFLFFYRLGEPRTVILHKGKKGFGFVLRGAKGMSSLV